MDPRPDNARDRSSNAIGERLVEIPVDSGDSGEMKEARGQGEALGDARFRPQEDSPLPFTESVYVTAEWAGPA
jgi:hypothetical protein